MDNWVIGSEHIFMVTSHETGEKEEHTGTVISVEDDKVTLEMDNGQVVTCGERVVH